MSSTTRGSTPMSRSRTMHRCAASRQPRVRAGGRTRGTRALTVGWRTDDALHTALPIAAQLRSHLHHARMHARTRARCASYSLLRRRCSGTGTPASRSRRPRLSNGPTSSRYPTHPGTVSRPSRCMVSHPSRCPTPHGVLPLAVHGIPPHTVSHTPCTVSHPTWCRCSPTPSWDRRRL